MWEWISIEDDLPKVSKQYICAGWCYVNPQDADDIDKEVVIDEKGDAKIKISFLFYYDVGTDLWQDRDGENLNGHIITHWQELILPKPPK